MIDDNGQLVMQTFISITNILEEITKRLDALENEIAYVSRNVNHAEVSIKALSEKLSGNQEELS